MRMVLVLLLVEVPEVLAAALAEVVGVGVVREIVVGEVEVEVVEGSGAGIPEDVGRESSVVVVGVDDEVVWTGAASVNEAEVVVGVGVEEVVGVLVVVGVEVVVGVVCAVEVAVTTSTEVVGAVTWLLFVVGATVGVVVVAVFCVAVCVGDVVVATVAALLGVVVAPSTRFPTSFTPWFTVSPAVPS